MLGGREVGGIVVAAELVLEGVESGMGMAVGIEVTEGEIGSGVSWVETEIGVELLKLGSFIVVVEVEG